MENESIKKNDHPVFDSVKLISYLLKCLDLFELVLIVQGNIYLPWVQNKALIRFHDMNISIKRSIVIRKGLTGSRTPPPNKEKKGKGREGGCGANENWWKEKRQKV